MQAKDSHTPEAVPRFPSECLQGPLSLSGCVQDENICPVKTMAVQSRRRISRSVVVDVEPQREILAILERNKDGQTPDPRRISDLIGCQGNSSPFQQQTSLPFNLLDSPPRRATNPMTKDIRFAHNEHLSRSCRPNGSVTAPSPSLQAVFSTGSCTRASAWVAPNIRVEGFASGGPSTCMLIA